MLSRMELPPRDMRVGRAPPCEPGDACGRPDRVGDGGGSPGRAPADSNRDSAGLRGGS